LKSNHYHTAKHPQKEREREKKTPMTQPKVAVNLAEGGENKRGKKVLPNRRLEKRNYLLF